MHRAALFLDRDGVINVDSGYVHRIEEVHFLDGIFDLVAAAKKAGYLVIVVTNQAGIGRGYYTEQDFHHLMDWMRSQFSANDGAIDAVYFCPDHPLHGIGKYKQDSLFRKPAPGMLLQAVKDHGVDLGSSILIGDKVSDVEAGVAAGVQHLFYLGETGETGSARRIRTLTEVTPYLKDQRLKNERDVAQDGA